MISRFLLLLFALSLSAYLHAQKLISHTLIKHYTETELGNLWKENKVPQFIVPINNGIKLYEIIYSTSWHDGSNIQASGLLFVPDNLQKELPQLIYHHGTRTIRKTALNISGENAISAGFAADGYLVLMPDYIGLGKGEKFHLYQNSASESTAAIDMLLAVQTLNKELNINTDKQLYLTGYSQGGHACLATQQKLQTEYSEQFPITASSPMSGAYDMSGVQATVMTKPYPEPVYLPYLLKGINEVYQVVGSDYTAMFKEPYDSLVPILYNGEYTLSEINTYLPEIPADVIKSEWMEQYLNNPDFNFNFALAENDLLEWAPESPTQLCYCNSDKIVLPGNAFVAYNKMTANGSNQVKLRKIGKKFGHVSCALFASIYTKMWFNSFRKGSKKGRRGPLHKRWAISLLKTQVK